MYLTNRFFLIAIFFAYVFKAEAQPPKQLTIVIEKPVIDTVFVTTENNFIRANTGAINFTINVINFRIGINNIPNSNIGFIVEKKRGVDFVIDSTCTFGPDPLLPYPPQGRRRIFYTNETISQIVSFPPSCSFLEEGARRVKYFFFYYDGKSKTTKRVETNWMYYYVKVKW